MGWALDGMNDSRILKKKKFNTKPDGVRNYDGEKELIKA